MDENKAWLVDFRVGYRCQALAKVQRDKAKEDEDAEKAGSHRYPQARKWSATEYPIEGLGNGGEDSQS